MFRESVRDKVLYNLVLFAILLIGASYLIGQLTAGQDVKIIKDLGLAATSIFGLFIAVFIGIGLVSKEVERRSIYSLLAKPIHRYQMVLGKYAGPDADAGGQRRRSWRRRLYAVLAYMAWGVDPPVQQAWDAPALDPALLKAIGADPRRADDRHGHRAVLLDLLDADAVGGVHLRAVRRRPLQHRPAQLRAGRRFAGRGDAGARPVLGAAEPRRNSTSRHRSSTRSRCRSGTWR